MTAFVFQSIPHHFFKLHKSALIGNAMTCLREHRPLFRIATREPLGVVDDPALIDRTCRLLVFEAKTQRDDMCQDVCCISPAGEETHKLMHDWEERHKLTDDAEFDWVTFRP